MSNVKKILIASGGTGGHIIPALSLYDFLKDENYSVKLSTDLRGMTYIKNINTENIKIIDTSTIVKSKKFKSFLKIISAIIKSFIFLIKDRPSLVIGMGGYSSFPICFSAVILKIPIIIYENNICFGKANKFLVPFAKKILVNYNEFEGIKDNYKHKIKVIGNILRKKILDFHSFKDDNYEKFNILILGGSQAAKSFAEKLPKIFIELNKRKIKIKIFQQCQPEQNEVLRKVYEHNKIEYSIFNYTHDMDSLYKQTNLAVTRAGSSALAELLNCRIPIIAIPLVHSADDHQYKNAVYYEKKGFGIMIKEDKIENDLLHLLQKLYNKKSILKLIKSNQSKYSDIDVFKKINSELKEFLYEN